MAAGSMTVIIPTCNPDRKLPELIRRLRQQRVLPQKMIIVHTQTQQCPDPLLPAGPGAELKVVHVAKEAFDHGGTRDLAARMADTDLLVFMTQDALPADRNLLGNLRDAFEDPEVACAYARQLPSPAAGPIERYTRAFNYGRESRTKSEADVKELGIKTFFCSNVCAAYRRDIYLKLGGFEKHVIFNEDMIYAGHAVKAGYSVRYCAQARVIHSHNYTAAQQLHRNFDLGVSQQMHPEVFGGISSEGEGVQLVKKTAAFLVRVGHAQLLGSLLRQSVCKYAGYRLGKAYRVLPHFVIRRLTMNPQFWEQEWKVR